MRGFLNKCFCKHKYKLVARYNDNIAAAEFFECVNCKKRKVNVYNRQNFKSTFIHRADMWKSKIYDLTLYDVHYLDEQFENRKHLEECLRH